MLNVLEWCEDDFHYGYTGAPVDGSAWVDSPRDLHRIGRGGSLINYGSGCRSACRYGTYRPSYAFSFVGFRLSR